MRAYKQAQDEARAIMARAHSKGGLSDADVSRLKQLQAIMRIQLEAE